MPEPTIKVLYPAAGDHVPSFFVAYGTNAPSVCQVGAIVIHENGTVVVGNPLFSVAGEWSFWFQGVPSGKCRLFAFDWWNILCTLVSVEFMSKRVQEVGQLRITQPANDCDAFPGNPCYASGTSTGQYITQATLSSTAVPPQPPYVVGTVLMNPGYSGGYWSVRFTIPTPCKNRFNLQVTANDGGSDNKHNLWVPGCAAISPDPCAKTKGGKPGDKNKSK